MTDLKAITLTGVDGGMLTDDRYYGLIRFTTEGAPHVVAIPSESLMTLGLLAIALAPAPPMPTPGKEAVVDALDVNWWTVSGTADGSVVLNFEMIGGGQIGFRLGQSAVSPFQEALLAATGSMPQTPGTPH